MILFLFLCPHPLTGTIVFLFCFFPLALLSSTILFLFISSFSPSQPARFCFFFVSLPLHLVCHDSVSFSAIYPISWPVRLFFNPPPISFVALLSPSSFSLYCPILFFFLFIPFKFPLFPLLSKLDFFFCHFIALFFKYSNSPILFLPHLSDSFVFFHFSLPMASILFTFSTVRSDYFPNDSFFYPTFLDTQFVSFLPSSPSYFPPFFTLQFTPNSFLCFMINIKRVEFNNFQPLWHRTVIFWRGIYLGEKRNVQLQSSGAQRTLIRI